MRAAIATIDLSAVRHNLERTRVLAPRARVVAVIKANGYGHGAVRLLPALTAADALGVACSEEAVELREAGARQPILLLEGVFEPAELDLCVRHELWAVVHDESQLDMLERARLARPVPVWLKIDSGMHRLGVPPRQAQEIWRRLRDCANVEPGVVLMSHFAAADDVADPATAGQLASFDEVTRELPGERSLANSAGVLGWPDAHRNWIRPGIMLYGVTPMLGRLGPADGLRPAMTLTTRLIAVREVGAGEAVGYGGAWQASAAGRIGIAAMGYGDGYPRHAPSGTPVLVNGRRAGLAGRVSMDMLAIDLTDQPDARVGDPVLLWGEGLPIEEVANAAGTIGYELLCHVTRRVHVRVTDEPAAEASAG